MKAVITVVGKDTVGILAKVSSACAEREINIVDVTQSVLQNLFVMVMLADISGMTCDFGTFSDDLKSIGARARNGHPRNARGHLQLHAPHLTTERTFYK